MFLTVLVYMQEQQNCSHKTGHIRIEIISNGCSRISLKDTHREKAPSYKTSTFSKGMSLGGWYIKSTLYMRLLYWSKIFKRKKKKIDTGKTVFFVIGPFCTPHSICLNIGFWEGSFVWICTLSVIVLLTTKLFSSFLKKRFLFFRKFVSKLSYWKHSKFQVIVNTRNFQKSLVYTIF